MENNIENALNFTTRTVQEIKKELVIGGGDLDLYVRCYLDDELVVDKKADSVLAGFLHILFLQMNGTNYQSMPDIRTVDDIYAGNIHQILSISSISGSVIRLSVSSGNSGLKLTTGSNTGLCSIQGVLGTSSLQDGTYPYSITASSASTSVGVNRFEIDLSAITASPITAGYTANSGSFRQSVLWKNPNYTGPSTFSFWAPQIVVGSGTAAVNIQDSMLEKEIQHGTSVGRLNYSAAISTNPDQPAGTSGSEMWFSKVFTNNSVSSCNVSEIGLYATYGQLQGNGYLLLMRDVIPAISIDPTRTLTVQYYLRSNLSTGTNPGGFLLNFMKFLYRHFGQIARSALDINNVDQSLAQTTGTFKIVAPGGEAHICSQGASSNGAGTSCFDPPWKQGVVLGTSTAAATINDTYLGTSSAPTHISHGATAGQLLYYGGFIQNWVDGTTAVSFDIVKAFENASGGSVTANEIGLVCGVHNDTTDGPQSEFPVRLFLIARNVLTTPVVVANGNMLKATYTIKVVI